jgi:hypothetical protein
MTDYTVQLYVLDGIFFFEYPIPKSWARPCPQQNVLSVFASDLGRE